MQGSAGSGPGQVWGPGEAGEGQATFAKQSECSTPSTLQHVGQRKVLYQDVQLQQSSIMDPYDGCEEVDALCRHSGSTVC